MINKVQSKDGEQVKKGTRNPQNITAWIKMKAKHSHVYNFPKYPVSVKNLLFSVLFCSWFSELSAVKMYKFLNSYCCFAPIK